MPVAAIPVKMVVLKKYSELLRLRYYWMKQGIANPTQMQNTRLSTLITTISQNTEAWFLNPWRRISLIIINLLLGFFLGAAISTGAGQRAEWDITAAAILVFFTEISSRIFYSRGLLAKRSLWVECLNCLKIGIIYSLFLEAFKLGS